MQAFASPAHEFKKGIFITKRILIDIYFYIRITNEAAIQYICSSYLKLRKKKRNKSFVFALIR
jgi:hypothetical protein